MRKLRRLLLRLFILIIILIAGIMIIKTLTFSSKQLTGITPIEPVELNDEVTQRFSKAIQIPTISTNLDTTIFRKLDTFIVQNYPNIQRELQLTTINDFAHIYKWSGSNPKLEPVLLMGHTDVVPVEEASANRWTVEPFGGVIKNGNIWGRGTIDDKLNVFAILEAVEMLLTEDYQPTRTIYLAFGHDEEVSGTYGGKAIATYFEENNIQFEYVLDEGQMILENALKGLDRPLAMIGIAEKGYTTLTLTAQLKDGGHSSMPPHQTAVGVLSKAINNLQENLFPIEISGATKLLFEYTGPEMSPLYKTLFANLWLTESLIVGQLSSDPAASALMQTTTAPTMLRGGVKDNVLPTRASAKVNFRILPGETTRSVRERVISVIDDKRVIVKNNNPDSSSNPSPISSTDSFGFRILQRTVQEIFPDAVIAPSLVIAMTDSRHFQNVSNNIYRFQPIQIKRSTLKTIHGIDEHISVENYHRAIRFYRQLMMNSGI